MSLRVVHLLRKYNPSEWGGTETAIRRLLEGLRQERVSSVVYCPRFANNDGENGSCDDPLRTDGFDIERFDACVPIWGISEEKRRALTSIGGNLMSFNLIPALVLERQMSVMHSHTLGRLGAIAQTIARRRNVPFVLSIHGGALDMNDGLKASLQFNEARGVEWGKVFGLLLKSRKLLDNADALIACNEIEAERLRGRYPGKRVIVQPHGVVMRIYGVDHRDAARRTFPQIVGRKVLLCVSRIDPVKNQIWLVEQLPPLLQRHADALLVLVGACTNEAYSAQLQKRIEALGLERHVLLAGGLPPDDPRLIGLIQSAQVGLLASVSETFGLVLLETWAASAPVVSSSTSGATALVRDGENGFLFDLAKPETFHRAVNDVLGTQLLRQRLGANGREQVARNFSAAQIAGRVKKLYEELIEEKHASCNHS